MPSLAIIHAQLARRLYEALGLRGLRVLMIRPKRFGARERMLWLN